MENECTQWQEWLSSEGSNQAGWFAHLASCGSCRENWEFHHRLQHWEGEPLPLEDEFRQMRSRVKKQMKSSKKWLTWALPLAACFIGFVAGMQWQKPAETVLPETNDFSQFSDFRILSQEGSTAHIGFMLNKYVELKRPIKDPMLQEMMAQSLLESPDLATRLSLLDDPLDVMLPEVKKALLDVCLEDPEMVVRAKAMDRLSALKPDSEIIDIMIQILKHENKVNLRLKALDYLTELDHPDPKVRSILQSLHTDPEPAIRVGAQDYPNSNLQ